MSSPTRARVRAPELTGRGWLNTGGEPLSLAGLRGKIVLLDFWTFCCVNCLHVLDELRPLEDKNGDVLVTIGVHSPKFEHEADADALVAAVERYEVRHPVLDDPDLVTWKAFAARAWPTLTVIDPEGYVVAQLSGEGHAHGLAILLDELVAEHDVKGTLHRGSGPYVPPAPPSTSLRFPGKLLALPEGRFLVSDTAHHQLVELDADLVTERRRIGSGTRGPADGMAAQAQLSEPQGLLQLPEAVAAQVGYDVVVADTVNHALRGLRLSDGRVSTVAGTGRQLRQRSGGGSAAAQDLSSPWDLAWFDDAVVVAMAGTHQLWRFDPVAGTVEVLAGTSAEGIRDGGAADAWFAQPSGLAVSADGATLWVADSETSALRHVHAREVDGSRFEVLTDVGTGLFDFGHVDGPAAQALLQHPLGVAVLPDGSVALCDTYNGAVRRFDPLSGEVTTLATGLLEPSDAVVDATSGDPVLVVVESAAHRLTRVAVPADAQRMDGGARRTQRPATDLAPGTVELIVGFVPPTGQKLDHRYGDPSRLVVGATPPELLLDGAGSEPGLRRTLRLADLPDGGVLHVSVQAAACDGDPETGEVPEFAACHLYQQDWGIPVQLAPGSPTVLHLDLRGA
ncbi:NHL domain-containing thioredoxin family protein [Angustibacter sp. McL0619]|uniref:NHL domain-containing thioredoxin family protein n=1 Tax=Angustibacter sp. McL0619 TaxID=3415676 RepID=UPI003CEC3810